MTQEIKPCPFCGSSNCEVVVSIYQKGGYKRKNCMVYCHDCSASGTETDEEDDAVSQWNKRTCTSSVAQNLLAEEFCASAWQPIETAPKDGSPMLLFWSGSQEIKTGHYCEEPFMKPYFQLDFHDAQCKMSCCQPTHWMPLPPPPKP